jgi:hypothetical protein
MEVPCSQTRFESFQIADKQRWLARRGYDGRVVRVESYLDVAGEDRHVIGIQAYKPYKRRLRLLPLSTAPAVRGVVSSATTAFKLFFGGRAPA